VTVQLAAPADTSLHLEQGLPAGAAVPEGAVSAAAAIGARLRVLSDRVAIDTRPFTAGETMTLELPVIPMFAGRFQTTPLEVSADGGERVALPPLAWVVAP
jgi:hypothetical protein